MTVVVNGRTAKRRFCPGSTCQAKAWRKANAERHAASRAEIYARESKATAADKGDCRYCDGKLPLGQKIQCGSSECRRKHKNAKLREMRAEYKRKHGRPYRAATHAKALRKRKALARNAPWEDFDDREIYERDGWICQLGFHPVDPGVAHPDPGCATIDHILPRSHGGGHIRDNVRLACLGCNVSRGNRVSDQDLVILGMTREELVLVS